MSSGASGSTGGKGQGSGGRLPARKARPNLWRSPLGAVAVAVAATAYWSTVAWLVAARTSTALIEVDNIGLVDELELGLEGDQSDNDGTGRLPPIMGDGTGDGTGDPACPHAE